MLRRSAEHLAAQQAYETEFRARMDVARKQRQSEKDRLDEAQRKIVLESQERAQQLALRRQKEREEANTWAIQRKAESEEEEEKKTEKAARKAAAKRAKAEVDSGEENQQEGGKKERKKKRTNKQPGTGVRKRRDPGAHADQDDEGIVLDGLPDEGDEDDAVFSGNEEAFAGEEDAPKRPKKVMSLKPFRILRSLTCFTR